jgi:hypothetical protein
MDVQGKGGQLSRRSAQATRYHRLEAFGVWREAAGLAS